MNASSRQYEIQQRIDAAEKRRTLAQAAEQERIDREQQAQREIEEANRELAALHQQQAQARVSDAVVRNDEFIRTQCDPAVTEFLATLDRFEMGKASFANVREAARRVDATFKQQRGIASSGANASYSLSNMEFNPNPNHTDDTNVRMQASSAGQYFERFASALDVRLALALYISQGVTPEAKDYRRGIAYFFVRYVMNEGQNTTIHTVKEQARREWLAQMTGR